MAKKDGTKAKPRRLEFEERVSTGEAAAYLEALANGLRDGVIAFADASEGLRFSVSQSVELEVEARQRKRKTRLEISLVFRHEDAEPEDSIPSTNGELPAKPTTTIPDEMSF